MRLKLDQGEGLELYGLDPFTKSDEVSEKERFREVWLYF